MSDGQQSALVCTGCLGVQWEGWPQCERCGGTGDEPCADCRTFAAVIRINNEPYCSACAPEHQKEQG